MSFLCQAGLVFLIPISLPEFSMGRWGTGPEDAGAAWGPQ